MLNKDGQRMLAYIATIDELRPIPNYDRVEHARTGGWWVVVRKGEFNVGDKALYLEVDSKVPSADERFAFLEAKHYKIKTQKMCKVYSQGLLMPLADFPELQNKDINDDVTELLKITYSVAEDNQRKSGSANPNAKYNSMAARHFKLAKTKWFRWLMKRSWGRKLLFVFFGKKKDKPKDFPTHFAFIHKTDEERCENCVWILQNKEPYIVTTKVDGTSSTYILERKPRNKFEFYVLSRNVRQMTPDQDCYHEENVYWDMEFKYHIKDFLQKQLIEHPDLSYVCLQGETAGVGVQGNPHKLADTQFFGFNYIDSKNGRWNSVEARDLCVKYGIQWVPIIDTNYILPDTMEELKLQADGLCEVPGSSGLREGYVYRSLDGKRSFKNVSRQYLLKRGE